MKARIVKLENPHSIGIINAMLEYLQLIGGDETEVTFTPRDIEIAKKKRCFG